MHHNEDLNINPVVTQFDALPDSAHIRPNTARIILGISIATFWRLVASRKIITYKLTERTTTVKVKDLRAFIASKASNKHE
jgi:hypothetical protein